MHNSEPTNALRFLSIDAVQKANSGHPGMPMGMAEIATALWKNHLNHNPSNPYWFNRDRFVLSNGHGSMLLYSLLHLTGYDLSIKDLKDFRKLKSKTPGHPEYDLQFGIETTTGPLGQGIANAVGMAIAEKILAAQFNTPQEEPIDHFTYAFLGDGCLMEGVSHEACSFAGTHNLGKLICFYDQNGISIDGEIENWFTDDSVKRFDSYGWQTIEVDGHNVDEINEAIILAKNETQKPTMIFCRTTIGFGSPAKAGTADAHGAPLGDEEIIKTRQALGWSYEPFEVPESVYDFWNATERGTEINDDWNAMIEAYKNNHPKQYNELSRRMSGNMPDDFDQIYSAFLDQCNTDNSSMATRKASQVCLDFFVKELPELVGGSADLTPSNNTFSKSSSTFSNENPSGNHINYGVREFGMSAIMNGMVLHGGIKPYGATFLVFTDYARNAVRLSALMGLPNIFVYTHDSIALGEDGPTHQPVEHLVTLRSTPNLNSWRPADLVETAVAWKNAVTSENTPTCLIFSRQNTSPILRNDNQIKAIENGGYLLDDQDNANINLIASGSELQLAIDAASSLKKEHGIISNIVSMPCLDKFLQQNKEYQSSVIKEDLPSLVIELSHPNSWYKILNKSDKVLGIETFGESAPANILLEHFGFTTSNVVEIAKSLVDE
ncbi:transketolase [Gammaproteobacteria bacterium]|nr:transketolase [Gammaproteobacteria bacterium]MDA9173836.1 transketolase [Gammaproteobacteria bacterium]MDA9903687.1 transketolase [Gammaproteobacteria bacterium]MDB4848936.1 transketolase [Gammaproteobacteria bacterium]MDC0402040.1 transketolase [Gammaproteobacteria bacterium]